MTDVVPNPQMIRVVPFVHVHGYNSIFVFGRFDDLVRLGHFEAHWLFGDDVRAAFERGQNHLSMQMVGCGYRYNVEVRALLEKVEPGLVAPKDLRLVTSPLSKLRLRAPGGFFRARGDGGQIKFYGCEIAGPLIETHPSQLRTDAGALEVCVGAGMNIAAKHPRSDQCYFNFLFHAVSGLATWLLV